MLNTQKIQEIRITRKRADTDLEMKWEKIAQIAQEARNFANYCISISRRRSDSSSSNSSITKNLDKNKYNIGKFIDLK